MNGRAEGVVNDIRYCLETRRRHIGELRQMAENHDQLARAFNQRLQAPLGTKIAGGVVLAAGGCVAVASTFLTGGLTAPLWASGLAIGGSGLSVGGAVWGISLEQEMRQSEEMLKTRVRELFDEDAEMQRKASRALENLQMLEFNQTRRVLTQLRGIINLYIGLNAAFGSTVALSVMLPLALTPIPLFCGNIATLSAALGPILTKAGEEIGKMVGKEPGLTKMYVQQQARHAAAKAAAKEAAKAAAKETTKETVKAAALKKAMTKAAEKAAEEATKTMMRITGSFNIVLGVGFALWDLNQLRDAERASRTEATSKLGVAFRDLANEVEAQMRNDDRFNEEGWNDEGYAGD